MKNHRWFNIKSDSLVCQKQLIEFHVKQSDEKVEDIPYVLIQL